MLTRELLAELQELAQGRPPEGPRGLRHSLNVCHRFMMSQDVEQNIYIDPATGRPPFIVTTTARQYNCPDNCRRVWKVGSDTHVPANTMQWYRYYNVNRSASALRQFAFRGVNYYDIPIQSIDRRGTTAATVSFPHNPTATTNVYQLFYYVNPVEILSDTINPQVQDQFYDMLIDGVLARIGLKEYGEKDNFSYWKNVIVKREFNTEMNKGAQGNSSFVKPRYC